MDQNSIGQANFLNQTSYRDDIAKFLKRYRPEALSVAEEFTISVVAGADDDQGPYTDQQLNVLKNAEAVLDSQQILSIAWPTPFEAINTGGKPPFKKDRATPINDNEPFLTFLNYIVERDQVPNVISFSYGEDEQTVMAQPVNYRDTIS